MANVIPFDRGPDDSWSGFDESAHLFDLCRIGNTRGFILRNIRTGDQRHFACVAIPNVPSAIALYSQLEGDGLTTYRFYFETQLDGGYSEAVRQAIQYLGDQWVLVEP